MMALQSVVHGGVTQGVRAADHCCHLHHHLDSFSVLFLCSEYLSVGVLSLHMGGDVRHRERWGQGEQAMADVKGRQFFDSTPLLSWNTHNFKKALQNSISRGSVSSSSSLTRGTRDRREGGRGDDGVSEQQQV